MRSEPRKISGDAELYAAALGALARRAHSSFELRTYLELGEWLNQPRHDVYWHG